MAGIEIVLAAMDVAGGWLSIDDSVFERPSMRLVSFVGVVPGVSLVGLEDEPGERERKEFGRSSASVDPSRSFGVTLRRLVSSFSLSLAELLRLSAGFLPYVLEIVEGIVYDQLDA